MAFQKLLAFSKTVSDLSDKPALTPTALKAQFDSSPNELKDALNSLIDALKSTTSSDSGAKNLGATAITDLSGADVQSLLESLKSYTDTNFYKKTDTYAKTETYSKTEAGNFVTGTSGTLTVAAGATVNYNITFPAGKFSGFPTLNYNVRASDINPLYTCVHGITSLSATGATISVINKGTGQAFVIFDWRAADK